MLLRFIGEWWVRSDPILYFSVISWPSKRHLTLTEWHPHIFTSALITSITLYPPPPPPPPPQKKKQRQIAISWQVEIRIFTSQICWFLQCFCLAKKSSMTWPFVWLVLELILRMLKHHWSRHILGVCTRTSLISDWCCQGICTKRSIPANINPMALWSWSTVCDVGPTLLQHLVNVLCRLWWLSAASEANRPVNAKYWTNVV